MSDLLKLSNQLCFPIYALSKEITSLYRPLLDKLDITYPQYLVLLVLWEKDNQTVSEIGKKLYLDSGTLTPLLKRLESKNIIVRTRLKTDERIVNISLTEKGLGLKESASCIPSQLMQNVALNSEELIVLKKLMSKILKK